MAIERKEKRLLIPDPGKLKPGMVKTTDDEYATAEDTIRISENVISAIVRKYTLEVPGVVRFAANSIVGGLAEMIGRKSPEGNIVVNLEGESVVVSVNLVLTFGVKVPEVAAMVQEVIRTRIEELTGKKVQLVNVTVFDLDEPPKRNDKPLTGEAG